MKILAIDQASNCGWAISTDIYGVWDLTTRRDESSGMKLIRFKAKLNEVCKSENIELIAYERVAGRFKASLIHAAKLVAIIESYCEENNINYCAYSAKEIKKIATGNGNASKTKMVEFAKSKLNYAGDNDNEADALWIWYIANKQYNN